MRTLRVTVRPAGPISGTVRVPGDKSIAHRWLLLALTAGGRSELAGLPPSLDVRSTARAMTQLSGETQVELQGWIHMKHVGTSAQVEGSLEWNVGPTISIGGAGRTALHQPGAEVDCGNSGTSLRLLSGVVAPCPFRSTLTGDSSLRSRPMERVAQPLREMGARVETTSGSPPVTIEGGTLTGIDYDLPVPSAQVKGAILLAATAAEGPTTVREAAPTRDHTEVALGHLGARIERRDGSVILWPFQHEGFRGRVPGDPSSAAFLAAAAALTGGRVLVTDVCLNPTRTAFMDVLRLMGSRAEERATGAEVGEPVGVLETWGTGGLHGVRIEPARTPALIDEVPILAVAAAHAEGESRFEGAGELRVKESDRLAGVAEGIRELGGEAEIQGDALVVAGGGLRGGTTDARRDHRLAMAFAVGALAARSPCTLTGAEWAEVSFPGFVQALRTLGADVEGAA